MPMFMPVSVSMERDMIRGLAPEKWGVEGHGESLALDCVNVLAVPVVPELLTESPRRRLSEDKTLSSGGGGTLMLNGNRVGTVTAWSGVSMIFGVDAEWTMGTPYSSSSSSRSSRSMALTRIGGGD